MTDGSTLEPDVRPASSGRRVLAVIAAYVIWVVLVGWGFTAQPPLEKAAQLIAIAAICGFMILVLPLVSYRRRDVFLLAVPAFGVCLLGLAVWRLAYLPCRDWAPRPDEAAGWRQVRHPSRPGALLYIKR
jgi:hypothetical protein